MNRRLALALIVAIAPVAQPTPTGAQTTRKALTSAAGLTTLNTVVAVATFKGKRGVRVTAAPDVTNLPAVRAGQLAQETLVRIDGVEFSSGVIEVEVAGAPAADADAGARGFIGIAFRLQPNDDPRAAQSYDAFYLRPTNGRAQEQERRNHSAQYISHPEWTWERLRRETPSRYEAYVDLLPSTWTKIRIEVRGARALLFVHDQSQPILVVNDLKSGASVKGGVALWIDSSTVGYFRNLTITALTP